MPILHSNMEADLRLASGLDQGLRVSLTDPYSVRNSPAAPVFLGSVNGSMTDTHRVRYAGLGGADQFAVTAAENTTITDTALADTGANIAVVRTGLMRQQSDLSILTGSLGSDVTPAVLAADMVKSYDMLFQTQFVTAGATASTDVGSTGVAMSVNNAYSAIYTLDLANNAGPYFAQLHGKQLNDFRTDLRTEGGAVQYHDSTRELLGASQPGLIGEWNGVFWFRSNQVTSNGTDNEGFMYSQGAFGYKIGVVDERSALESGASTAVRMDELLVEIERVPAAASVNIVGSAYFGISVLEQSRLVGIVTLD